MKPILWFSALLVVVGSAMAQTDASRAAAAPKSPPKKAVSPARVSAKDVQELRDALAAQQMQSEEQRQQLEQLKSQLQQLLDATQQASANAQKVQGSAEQAQATAAQAQQSAAEAQRQADQVSSSVHRSKNRTFARGQAVTGRKQEAQRFTGRPGRFRFIGDIRVRGEDFFQDCSCSTRNRARIRLRFGVEGKLNEDFLGGLPCHRIAGRFHQHQRDSDQFLHPQDHRHRPCLRDLQSRRRKVDVPHRRQIWLYLERTPMTFDSDLNPEGFTEKFSFDLKSPVLKNFTVKVIQLLYNEASRGDDSFAVGGQVSSNWTLAPLNSTASFSLLDWRFPDAILRPAPSPCSPHHPAACRSGRRARLRRRLRISHHGALRLRSQGFTNATFKIAPANLISSPGSSMPTLF